MFGLTGRRAIASVALAAASLAAVSPARAQTATTAGPVGPPPKAYIVVDQATGAVLSASNERMPLPPASLTKIITALAAVAALGTNDSVPITERAAGMPAHKLNMHAGEVWPVGQALSALLASSANDAAMALAERVSGSAENFEVALGQLATHLRMADAPTLRDPAGLDDYSSVGGGNLVSARDLAIAARAVLAEPRLASIVANPVTEFVGPDGVHHRLINHNKLLRLYPGAIGMKTGFTKKAGRGLIAAATRNGRTEIAVVMNVGDTYGWAAQLLDAAFAQPVTRTGDRLPAIVRGLKIAAAKTTVATDAVVGSAAPASATLPAANGAPLALRAFLITLALLAIAWSVLRFRVVMRRHRRRRRRAHAQVKRQVHRRRDPNLTPHYRPDEDLPDRFHEVSRH